MVWYRRWWAYRWQRWAYHLKWLSASSPMVLSEPSRMVHNDWVWVWVQIVANGVVGAVANGSQRLGLGLGSDRREWCCRTIANGFARPSWMVIGNGLGVIGGGEARRRLGLGVKLDGDWVWEWGSNGFWFQKNQNWIGFLLSFWYIYIYIYKLLVTKLFSSL